MSDSRSEYDPLRIAVRSIAERCPRLAKRCYWAGTSVIAIEELGHRMSFDLDFHTIQALVDTRPFLTEVQHAFRGDFEILEAPDEMGSSFGGLLTLAGGERVPVQVMSNYEDVPGPHMVASTTAPPLRRVSLERYLADKIQCIVERVEARDLLDVAAVLDARGDLETAARRFVGQQDGLLLAERLTGWTRSSIEADLRGYPGVDPRLAIRTRDRLLGWLRESTGEERPR